MNGMNEMYEKKQQTTEHENYLYVGEKLDDGFLQQLEHYICYKKGKLFKASDNTEARVIIENNAIRVVLVDQFLNSWSGIEFMRWMYSFAYIPTILLIQEKNAVVFETVVSLEAGAADAISDEVSVRELAARIKACNRKQFSENNSLLQDQHGPGKRIAKPLHKRPLYYTPQTRRLYFSDSSRTVLHGKEAELLDLLILRYPDYVNRNEISEMVFQRDWNPRDRSVDNLISRLLKTIDCDEYECTESIIETVRNEGYKLRTPIGLLPAEQAS